MDQVLLDSRFREVLSLAKLREIAATGRCRMPSMYFMDTGVWEMNAEDCVNILDGYIDYLERVPNFHVILLDDETLFMNRCSTNRFFRGAQIGGGAAMAFMHGAQDGQKFIAVFLLGVALASGQGEGAASAVPLWLMVVCSLVMGLGTSIGGYRIIKSVGMDMVKLTPYQGFAADTAAALCLLFSSLTGIPVSTTHTKTTAIMGVGASRRLRSVNWATVKDLVLTWVLTFPGCGLIGYVIAKIFLYIFM